MSLWMFPLCTPLVPQFARCHSSSGCAPSSIARAAISWHRVALSRPWLQQKPWGNCHKTGIAGSWTSHHCIRHPCTTLLIVMLGHRYQLHPIECNCINTIHNELAQSRNMQISSIPKLHQPGKNIYLCHQFQPSLAPSFDHENPRPPPPNATFSPWK